MDFKRIEWIFFLAFLGVNIFLFSIYHAAQNDESGVTSSNQKVAIEQRLKSDNVAYEGKLSDKKKSGYYLSGEQTNMADAVINQRKESGNSEFLMDGTTFKDNQLTHVASDNYYISDDKETEKTLQNFLKLEDQVLFGSEYTYLSHLSFVDQEYPEIFAGQSFEGIPFNDPTSRLEINLENADDLMKITSYTQTHLSNIEKLREKMTLYSEKDAINTLYINNKIPQKSKIVWRQLAYTMILRVREKNVYVPAWFIAIQTNDSNLQVETVNAFSNRIITNNTLQKVENTN